MADRRLPTREWRHPAAVPSRPAAEPADVIAESRKADWRTPPLALLQRPPWSRGRLVGMWALRIYLLLAVLLLLVKAIELATGH